MANTDERDYKAVRDEQVKVFDRVFVVLSATIAASAFLISKILELSSAHRETDALLLGIVYALLLGLTLLLTAKLYDNIYRLASYLIVYHEVDGGWHRRNRDLTREHETGLERTIPDVPEQRLVLLVYGLLSLVATWLIVSNISYARSGNPFLLLVAVAFVGCYFINLLLVLWNETEFRFHIWVVRWEGFKNNEGKACADPSRTPSGDGRQRHRYVNVFCLLFVTVGSLLALLW